MNNANLTICMPKEMKKEMQIYKEINWSEEARRYFRNRLHILKTTKIVEKAIHNNEQNATAINEFLQKLIKEGKLNTSNDFDDIYEQNLNSLKEVYAKEDDTKWKELISKNTYKKK